MLSCSNHHWGNKEKLTSRSSFRPQNTNYLIVFLFMCMCDIWHLCPLFFKGLEDIFLRHSQFFIDNCNTSFVKHHSYILLFEVENCLLTWINFVFIIRNSSCGKVMFLYLSVILFTGVKVYTPRQKHPLGRHHPADTPLPRKTALSRHILLRVDTPGHTPLSRHPLKVCPHRAKAIMKAKKIKEQSEGSKNKWQTSKKFFAFAWSKHCFRQTPLTPPPLAPSPQTLYPA